MAMNGNTLGQEIAAAIMHSGASPDVQAKVIELWQKISTVIVNHIQTNAEVPLGINVSVQVSVDPTSHQGGGTGATTGVGRVT